MSARDRRISILAADYTDLALGLGDTKAYLACLDFSSAQLRSAWAAWQKMSTSLIPEPVSHGKADPEMDHLAGLLAAAWLRREDFGFRYLQIHAKAWEGGPIESLLLCKGDFQSGKPDMGGAIEQVRRLLGIYGLSNLEMSDPIRIGSKSRDLSLPMAHPNWREWCEQSFARTRK